MMALSRVGSVVNLPALSRTSPAGFRPLGSVHCTRPSCVHQKRINSLHVTSVRRYPDAPSLPLPTNVSEIFASETVRFAPERARDIATPILIFAKNSAGTMTSREPTRPFDRHDFAPIRADDGHVDSYDCFGAVSLNGTMQSNVPKPFCSAGKSTHLNMPGGQWARDGKYIAEDMQKSHYRSSMLARLYAVDVKKMGIAINTVLTSNATQTFARQRYIVSMGYSSNAVPQAKQSRRERFNKTLKDFGIACFIFHVTISLISLGACYVIVASGIDVRPFLEKMAGAENEKIKSILQNSTVFVVAYTVHKAFAPLRLGLTVSCVPPLVMFLRRRGIMRTPVQNPAPNPVQNSIRREKQPPP